MAEQRPQSTRRPCAAASRSACSAASEQRAAALEQHPAMPEQHPAREAVAPAPQQHLARKAASAAPASATPAATRPRRRPRGSTLLVEAPAAGAATPTPRLSPRQAIRSGGPWRVVFWAALAVFVLALAALAFILFSYWQGQRSYEALASEAFEAPALDAAADARAAALSGVALSDLSVDWDALLAVNPDTVAWVYIPGTPINYPIVKAPADNPDHYLTYDFEGNPGGRWMPTYGTPYLYCDNASDFSDKNNVVQGHHLQNGEMFAALTDFDDTATFNERRNVYLLTPQGSYRLSAIAFVRAAGDEPIVQTEFSTAAEFTAYVQDKLDRSEVEPDPVAPSADEVERLFMFSTCDADQAWRDVLYCTSAEFAPASGTAAAGSAGTGSGASATVDPNDAGSIDKAAKEITQ